MTIVNMTNSYIKAFGNIRSRNNYFSQPAAELQKIAQKYNDFNANRSKIKAHYTELAKQYKGQDFLDAVSGTKKIDTSALKSSADKLTDTGKNSLFIAGEDGSYDRDKIASAVNDFVNNYNSVKGSVSKSDDTRVLEKGVFMVGTVQSYSKLLGSAGISINTDNTLSVDTDKLKSAEISTLKTLFNGSNSFADRMSQKASQIKEISDLTRYSYTTYRNNGMLNYASLSSAGSVLDLFG